LFLPSVRDIALNSFTEALVSREGSSRIPDGFDWFAPVIGEWTFDYFDRLGEYAGRHVTGEWVFSRILEGIGVQDVFICPSRAERATAPQPDAEYGTTLRIFNPATQAWDIFYGCAGRAVRLEARRVESEIVLTEVVGGRMQWIFSEMAVDSFHWRHQRLDADSRWRVWCEVFAKRRRVG
jgi:hypothetical protein